MADPAPVVEDESASPDEAVEDTRKRAAELALSITNPETLARKLQEFIAEKYPDRVGTALLITASGTRDRGITVTVARRSKLSLEGLIGSKTAGIGLAYKALEGDRFALAVGLGVVTPFDDFGHVEAAGFVSIRF